MDLRGYREGRDLTCFKLAVKAGLGTSSNITAVEKFKKFFTPAMAQQLAPVIGVPWEELLLKHVQAHAKHLKSKGNETQQGDFVRYIFRITKDETLPGKLTEDLRFVAKEILDFMVGEGK